MAETEGESLVDTMSTANSVASGLDCASPESIMDPTNLTPAGDQYSLGCVLYHCLTGQPPFPHGSAAEKMMAHQFQEPTPISELSPEVPAELVAVVVRLMQKAPEQRFASAAEAVEALRAFAVTPAAAKPAPRPLPGAKTSAPPPRPTAPTEPAKATTPLFQPPARKAGPTAPPLQPRPRCRCPAGKVSGNRRRSPNWLPSTMTTTNPRTIRNTTLTRKKHPASLDERLGTIGIIVIAVIACAGAMVLTKFLLGN